MSDESTTVTEIPLEDLSPFDRRVAVDPYPYYTRLRDLDGVYYSTILDAWLLARYDDVFEGFSDSETYASAPPGGSGSVRFLLTTDPPEHTELRGVVNRFFTAGVANEFEPKVRSMTRDLLDGFGAALETGRGDLVQQLIAKLPVMVISALMGMPVDRHEDFRRWSDTTVGGVNMPTRDVARATIEMGHYFRSLIADRQAEPGDDLISQLITNDEPLTDDELQMFCGMLLIAGNETTTNLISNTWLALLKDPAQLDLVKQDRSMIKNAVEETLRYDAPVQAVWRVAARDVEIRTSTLKEGDRVILLQGSAGRDERQTKDPDVFDLSRETIDHLGFGGGPHYCLGTNFAKLESQVLAEELLDRFPNLKISGEVERRLPPESSVTDSDEAGSSRVRRNPVVRGLTSMPVELAG